MSTGVKSNKTIKIIVLIVALLVVVCGAIAVFFNIRNNKDDAMASQAYEASKKYSEIIDSSTPEQISEALNVLVKTEFKLPKDSFYFSQMNFYQANLYSRIKNIEMENACLEDIITNAKKDNYLLPISIYRFAVNKEEAGDIDGAFELYKKFWNMYSDTHSYSQMVAFALFRISYSLSNTEEAKKYSEIINEKYPSTSLTNFIDTLF